MKKEQVPDLMNAIPPDLIEEADLQAPARRRLPRPVRAGLIAACLCLALVGTVTAAKFLGVRIQNDGNGDVWLSGGIAYYHYDSLSDEIKAIGDTNSIIPLSTWQEVENLIGLNLMDNPVLDASPATQFSLTFDGVNGRFLVITSPGLYQVRTYGCYEMGEVNITVESALYTDHMDVNWDETFLGFSFSEETELDREFYTAPSGLETQLLKIDRAEGRRDTWLAAFSLNGVPFVVRAHSDVSIADAHAALIQILDGFVLSE